MKKYILAMALVSGGCDYLNKAPFKQVSVDLGDLGDMNNIIQYRDGKAFYLCRKNDNELKVTDLPAEFINGANSKQKLEIFYKIDLCED